MPPVPRLTNTSSPNSSPNNTTGADAAAAAATAEANTLREQLTTLSGHVEALEKQLAALKAMVEAHVQPTEPMTESAPKRPRRT